MDYDKKRKIISLFLCATIAVTILVLFISGAFHTHTLKEEKSEATCTQAGIIREYCTECDFVVETEIPSLMHNMQEYIVDKKSTCTENGSATYKCTLCGLTENRTLFAAHKMSDNVCTVCGLRKSSINADSWYTLSSNSIFHCQNAEVDDAVSMSNGRMFLVTYYPVCKNCHICGNMQMTSVGINTPISEANTCKSCKETTYSRFKIEY